MGAIKRVDRINQLLRAELAGIVQREIKDPRVQSVTVQDVDCSVDLGVARIYVSVYDDHHSVEEAVAGLQSAAGYVRRLLHGRLELKKIPELRFMADETLANARRIEKLLVAVQADIKRTGDPE